MQRKTTTSVLGGSKVISKNPAIMEPLRASAVQLAAQHLEVVSAVKEVCPSIARERKYVWIVEGSGVRSFLVLTIDGHQGHLGKAIEWSALFTAV